MADHQAASGLNFRDEKGRLCVPETQVVDDIKTAMRAGRHHGTVYTVERAVLPPRFDLAEMIRASPQDDDYRVSKAELGGCPQSTICRELDPDDPYDTQAHAQWLRWMRVEPEMTSDPDALHATAASIAHHHVGAESFNGNDETSPDTRLKKRRCGAHEPQTSSAPESHVEDHAQNHLDDDYRVSQPELGGCPQSTICRELGPDDPYDTQAHEQWLRWMRVLPETSSDPDALHANADSVAHHDRGAESFDGNDETSSNTDVSANIQIEGANQHDLLVQMQKMRTFRADDLQTLSPLDRHMEHHAQDLEDLATSDPRVLVLTEGNQATRQAAQTLEHTMLEPKRTRNDQEHIAVCCSHTRCDMSSALVSHGFLLEKLSASLRSSLHLDGSDTYNTICWGCLTGIFVKHIDDIHTLLAAKNLEITELKEQTGNAKVHERYLSKKLFDYQQNSPEHTQAFGVDMYDKQYRDDELPDIL